jgi:Ser/Thr protein kinase RdoA (MazF antagonist)
MSYSQPWNPQTTDGVFPVIYSTLACQALVNLILPHYGIAMPVSCQFWHRGLSDVYLVETAKTSYILRVSHHHWRSKTEIDFELELLDFLHQQEIPVAFPLKTQAGNLSVEINAPEGKRYAALFIYAPGSVALGDLNPTQSRLLGQTVAKLHQGAREFRSLAERQPLNLDYLLYWSLQQIAPFLQHRPQDLDYLVKAITEIEEQLQSLPSQAPYWGICWGDPHSGNVHFTSENQITLFDFDQCGYGWRVFDIAKFWQVALQTGLSRTVREAFVTGYQDCQKITEVEYSALKPLTQMAQIWAWAISLNSAKLHNYSRLDEHYFNQRLQQLKRVRSCGW